MISANKAHYAFLQQANRTDTQYLTNLSVVQRDYYFNRAKDFIMEQLAKQAESSSTMSDYLRDVTIRDTKLSSVKKDDHYFANYPEDYYHTLGMYVDAKKVGCDDLRRFPVRRPNSDKIRRALKNSNIKRFWDFEETLAIQQDKGYQVFTEEGLTYDIYLDYIRKVPDIASPEFEGAEKYIDSDGNSITTNKNLEIDNIDLFHKMISVAVLMSKRDYAELPDYELQLKTLMIELK